MMRLDGNGVVVPFWACLDSWKWEENGKWKVGVENVEVSWETGICGNKFSDAWL